MLGHDNLEGWDGMGGGREVQDGGDICIPMVIHVDVWQKPTKYCNYPPIKNKFKKNFKKKDVWAAHHLTVLGRVWKAVSFQFSWKQITGGMCLLTPL